MAAGAAQAAVEGQSCPLRGCGQGLPTMRHTCAAEGLGWLWPGWTGTVVRVRLWPSAGDPHTSPPAQTAIPAGRAWSWGPTRPLMPKAGAAVAACIPPAGATSASAVMLPAVGRTAVVPAPPAPCRSPGPPWHFPGRWLRFPSICVRHWELSRCLLRAAGFVLPAPGRPCSPLSRQPSSGNRGLPLAAVSRASGRCCSHRGGEWPGLPVPLPAVSPAAR